MRTITTKRPRLTGMPNGRPRIEITKDLLISLYGEHHNWNIVAEELGVSKATVFNRMKEYQIKKKYDFFC